MVQTNYDQGDSKPVYYAGVMLATYPPKCTGCSRYYCPRCWKHMEAEPELRDPKYLWARCESCRTHYRYPHRHHGNPESHAEEMNHVD